MSTVMILAGSRWQISIVESAKKLGHRTVVVNPYPDSPAFAYADEHELADILDRETCLALARKHQIDAITSEQCEIALPTIDYVASELGLPTIGSHFVELYTNKVLMREFCRDHGMPYPEFRRCRTLAEALEFFRGLGRPMILKPLDNHSSRGVFTIRSEADLRQHFDEALSLTYAKDKAVVCERYISGTEFTVDGIVTADGHVSLAVSEKEHYAHNENVACALRFTNQHPRFDYEKLRQVNDAYVDATGLSFGLTHAEYKLEDGTFYLIEIGARGGGNRISSHVVPAVSGICHNELLIRQVLGEKIRRRETAMPEAYRDRAAVLEFFQFPAGHCVGLKGVDFLENDPRILDYFFNFRPGDTLQLASDDNHRAGYFIAATPTADELDALRAQIRQRVMPVYD